MGPTGTQAGRMTSALGDFAANGRRRAETGAPELLRRIVEHAPVLIAVVEGPRHRVRLANAAARALLSGARPVRGREVAELLPAAVAKAAIPILDKVLASRRCVRLREFGTQSDEQGGMRYWDASLMPLRSAGGAEAIAIVANEVTALVEVREKAGRMAAEAVRRASEADEAGRMLDALMAYIPEGIAIADAPGMRVRRVSYHGLAMTKRPWQEVLEDIPPERIPEQWQIYHLDGRTLAQPDQFPLARAAARGEIITSEQWLLRQHSGRLVPVLCNAGPIRDGRGRITGAVMSWLDVSSLAEARSQLLDVAKRFELAIEAAELGMWRCNLRTGELAWSDRCKTMLGLKPETELSYALFVQTVHPEDRERMDAAMRRAADPGGDGRYVGTFRVIQPDGGQRWISATGRTYFDETATPCLIVAFRDVTGQVETANERDALLEQNEKLRRDPAQHVDSLQIIDSLIPLHTPAQPPAARRALEKIRLRVQTMRRLHQGLARARGRVGIDAAVFLKGACADLAGTLGHGAGERIRVVADVVHIPAGVALPLGLIANELILNAFRHAHDDVSSAEVDVRFERTGHQYLLTVRDNGRGFPTRFHPETAPGTGLRMVSGLAGRLGGELAVGPAGRGAWVRVSVPATAA